MNTETTADELRAAIENGLECYSIPCSDNSGDIVVHIQQTVDEIYKRVIAAQKPADVEALLRDMRCEVIYTHEATMSIPLYERMKDAIAAMGKPIGEKS